MSEQKQNSYSKRTALADSVFGGLLFIGIGTVWWQDWWWPGVLTVFGIAGGLAALIRGSFTLAAILIFTLAIVPMVYYHWPEFEIPWASIGPVLLIGVGVITLLGGVLTFLRRK